LAYPKSPEIIKFTPKGGGEPVDFNFLKGMKPLVDMMQTSADYDPGATGRPMLNVDASGNASLTGGSNGLAGVVGIVNNHELAPGETVAIKPGDSVQIESDIGDRWQEFELRQMSWGKSLGGTPKLGSTVLKPNTSLDLGWDESGSKFIKRWEPGSK
jgi:hypothetical protein